MLFIYKLKQVNSSLLTSLFFYSNSQCENLIFFFFFMHSVFSFQRGCDSLGASTDKVYFHADRPFKIP